MSGISLCPFAAYKASAQETGPETAARESGTKPLKTFRKEYTIYFRINRYDIDTAFRGNGATIRKMQKDLDSLIGNGIITTDSISIVSAASPDGRNAFNVWLSKKRNCLIHSMTGMPI